MSLTFESVAAVISRRFKIDRSKISQEATFEELGLDSLAQVELLMTLKKELGVELTDSQLDEVSRVSDLITVANEAA